VRRAWGLLLLAACADDDVEPRKAAPKPASPAVPERVVYDQILIAFKDSYRVFNPDTREMELKSDTERPREAAAALARRVFDRARAGSDFEALKREYTDARDKDGDVFGPIHAARDDVKRELYEIYRRTLYPGPAEVIFGLGVGEVGLVEHDPKRCPDGWLIIKRLK
jgi:hypothetical protein